MAKVRQLHPFERKSLIPNQLVTAGDLEDFKNDLIVFLRQLLKDLQANSPKKWLKSYEVKKMLEISGGTLQTLRNNGTLPFTKIGGIMYYDSEAIEQVMLKKQKQFQLAKSFR